MSEDFGEPWRGNDTFFMTWILEITGRALGDFNKSDMGFRDRAIECVNALTDCPNPEKFVEKIRQLYKTGNFDRVSPDPDLDWLDNSEESDATED